MKAFLPFTYPWIIKHHLGGAETVLDIGCGDGKFMSEINRGNKYKVTGVELFAPYIKRAKETGAYEMVIKRDVRQLNFGKDSFDAVICSQVIEHLKKKDALKVINDMEKFARIKVIIGTPNGRFHQEAYDENVLQRHQSSWQAEDLRERGYKVYGQALKFIYGEGGLLNTRFGNVLILRPLLFLFSYLLSPAAYFKQELGAHIIGVKGMK